ncbi:hypothetical protein D9M68_757980 [compost metagenome]
MRLANAATVEAVDLLSTDAGDLQAFGGDAQCPVFQARDALLRKQQIDAVLKRADALGNLVGQARHQGGPMLVQRPGQIGLAARLRGGRHAGNVLFD